MQGLKLGAGKAAWLFCWLLPAGKPRSKSVQLKNENEKFK
jgi:hypothetical protein